MTEKSMHLYRENTACNKSLETMLQATRQKGFTLIELLVTMIVLSILLTVGIPSYMRWINDSRMDSTTRSLAVALKHARSEAVSQQSVVTVGSGTINTLGDWAKGFHSYVDADGAGDALEAGDITIKNIDLAMDQNITVTSNPNTNYISFTGNGLLNGGGVAIRLDICDSRGIANSSQININIVGRISITNPAAVCPP